jgi:hypothetical protein
MGKIRPYLIIAVVAVVAVAVISILWKGFGTIVTTGKLPSKQPPVQA